MTDRAYRLGGFAQYVLTDAAGTVRAAGGDFGGGSETLVVTRATRMGKASQAHCAQGTGRVSGTSTCKRAR